MKMILGFNLNAMKFLAIGLSLKKSRNQVTLPRPRIQELQIITTWGGLAYIGAIKINDDGSIKLNSHDGTYHSVDIVGTWTLNDIAGTITFTVLSFSKEFSVSAENGVLILESSTYRIKHKAI